LFDFSRLERPTKNSKKNQQFLFITPRHFLSSSPIQQINFRRKKEKKNKENLLISCLLMSFEEKAKKVKTLPDKRLLFF
jgi:hypothetical protein